ncbi:MAG: Uma2 family endonuclease [Pseudomonadota bacterium]|nr:Uma2 family endonuclease [Pseudomonadota bacterium]
MNSATTLPAVARHRLTLDEYHALGAVLDAGARLELIDGEVYDMAPIGSRHADLVEYLGDLLRYALPPELGVRRQNPVTLGAHSEPQPDLCVVRARALPYSQAHPQPEDILLIVEVAEHTLDYDRNVKLPLYARFAIPEAWIVNIPDRQVEIHTDPGQGGYQSILHRRGGGRITPQRLPGVTVDVQAIFSRL